MGFLRTLATFQKPLLAAVHGQTVGIGVTMLLHCDLIVAARATQFSHAVREPGPGARRPPARCCCRACIGPQRAAELLLLGRALRRRHRAVRLGLVNRVVEEAALMEEARALAGALAAPAT